MRKKTQLTREQMFLRVGAVCAILGTAVAVAAGTGFDNITNELGTQAVLRYISSRPDWYWPTVQLGFILGALLWVGALAALASSLTRGGGWASCCTSASGSGISPGCPPEETCKPPTGRPAREGKVRSVEYGVAATGWPRPVFYPRGVLSSSRR